MRSREIRLDYASAEHRKEEIPPARKMVQFSILLCAFLAFAPHASAEEWRSMAEPDRENNGAGAVYIKRTAVRPSDGKQVTAHLVSFTSRTFRLEVVDLGDGAKPEYSSIVQAFRANGCVAGVNGGFFHADWRPTGLTISRGRRINRFETAKLLSGVIYSDDRGIHLMRRAGFRDHPGITALLQTGPYLIDGKRPVRGLSSKNSRRRTFIATDWRRNWILGATTSWLTLAELAEVLASPGALAPWPVDRAINLDGGSSTGFFFDRGPGADPILKKPLKRVRNLLGITAR